MPASSGDSPAALSAASLAKPKRLQRAIFSRTTLAIGLIFRHGPGAVFGALFLLKTRFGAGLHFIGPGLTSSGCHNYLLLRGDRAGMSIVTLLLDRTTLKPFRALSYRYQLNNKYKLIYNLLERTLGKIAEKS